MSAHADIRRRAAGTHLCPLNCSLPECQAEHDRARLLRALDAVLALHKPDGGHNPHCYCGIEPGSGATCAECGDYWPCPTVAAVNDVLEADK